MTNLLLLCVLQSSWVIAVELAIGPEEGISYLTDKGSAVSITADTHPAWGNKHNNTWTDNPSARSYIHDKLLGLCSRHPPSNSPRISMCFLCMLVADASGQLHPGEEYSV